MSPKEHAQEMVRRGLFKHLGGSRYRILVSMRPRKEPHLVIRHKTGYVSFAFNLALAKQLSLEPKRKISLLLSEKCLVLRFGDDEPQGYTLVRDGYGGGVIFSIPVNRIPSLRAGSVKYQVRSDSLVIRLTHCREN